MALLALGVVACRPEPQPPLVVGTITWVGTEPLFLARELGLLPAGQIHLAEYLSITQELQAFRNGVIDAAAVSIDEGLILDYLGQQAHVVLAFDASHGADCLVARPEVKTLADLKGRVVSSEDLTTLPTFLLTRALEQAGLRMEDVQRVFQNQEKSEEKLRRGEVDAVVSYEPYCQQMVAAGAHVLFDSARMPGELVDVLIVRRSYLEAYPERVDTLLRGWFGALDHYQADPAESARLMAPRLGVNGPQLLEALKGVRFHGRREQQALFLGEEAHLPRTIQRLGALMVRQGLLPAAPAVDRLINSEPLWRVVP